MIYMQHFITALFQDQIQTNISPVSSLFVSSLLSAVIIIYSIRSIFQPLTVKSATICDRYRNTFVFWQNIQSLIWNIVALCTE